MISPYSCAPVRPRKPDTASGPQLCKAPVVREGATRARLCGTLNSDKLRQTSADWLAIDFDPRVQSHLQYTLLSHTQMANNVSLNHAPDAGFIEESAGGVVNVDGPLIGRSLIDSIRRKISPSVLVQDGDLIMDRSRDLLRRHFQLMEVRDQDEIRDSFDE
jgi:hypothetical protein